MRGSRAGALAAAMGMVAVLAVAGAASAAPPEILSYQGVLTDEQGRAVPDGDYKLAFSIYDDPTAGSLLFVQTVYSRVTNGLYNVLLSQPDPGSQTMALPDALAGSPRLMEVEIIESVIGGQTTTINRVLDPRQVIASVPYALVAGTAQSVSGAEQGIPIGAIILWDQPTGCSDPADPCPCGYQAVTAFNGRTIRGADLDQSDPVIPDDPGMPLGADTLTIAQMPQHDHNFDDPGHTHTELSHNAGRPAPSGGGTAAGPLTSNTSGSSTTGITLEPQGNGDAHYHSAVTVLFCRKL